jgi:hypothetical protein
MSDGTCVLHGVGFLCGLGRARLSCSSFPFRQPRTGVLFASSHATFDWSSSNLRMPTCRIIASGTFFSGV